VRAQYNAVHNVVVSCDQKGLMEYWGADTFAPPARGSHGVRFALRSDTDLFEFAKVRAHRASVRVCIRWRR
jgi:hypothetical protein